MATFAQRLQRVQRTGNLTIADLARWFDRPYATMRCWSNGTEPGGGPIDRETVIASLELLEARIKAKRGFPLARMSPQERVARIIEMRP